MRELLGGKGANVAEMTRVLGPDRVPAGFTITTEACVEYMRADRPSPTGWPSRSPRRWRGWRSTPARRWATASDPLLVSVRSGARESMPGMLDTVLNLGLNDESVEGLADTTEQRAVRLGLLPPVRADVRQRLARDPGRALRGRDHRRPRPSAASREDTELDVDALRELTDTFKEIYADATGEDVPAGPAASSCGWRSARCSTPGSASARSPTGAMNRIPDDWGTAVNVQQMVFGNKGDTSGSGVAFSPRRGHRRAGASRRLPAQRPGRGRRLRGAHPARHRRDEGLAARGPRAADGDPAHARAPLRGHAGHRVHGRGGAAVHAPDAQRQAARPGGGAVRGRRGRRGPAHPRAGAA